MNRVPARDNFFAGARQGALPLLIWATHFFGAYVFVALACHAGLDKVALAGMTALRLVLLAGSVVMLAWLAALVVRACLALRVGEGGGTLACVRLGAAALALVGVLWTTLPIVVLPACGGWSGVR